MKYNHATTYIVKFRIKITKPYKIDYRFDR